MAHMTTPRSPGNTPIPDSARFARPTLAQYAEMILNQAGLNTLGLKSLIFRDDPGRPVGVSLRMGGGGYDYRDSSDKRQNLTCAGWLLFERHPAPEGYYLRARLFETFAGASAEFATRLVLQQAGNVTIRELERDPNSHHRGRNMYLAFEGIGPLGMCSMLVGPAATALDTATRLFWR